MSHTLDALLTSEAAAWLEQAEAAVAADPSRLASVFPAVSRHCGRQPVSEDDEQGLRRGTVDDAARARLLTAAPLRADDLVDAVLALYRFGDAGEKRGVLRALHLLDEPYGAGGVGPRCRSLVDDGLRSNDIRLVAAAVGPYGARHLSDQAWRQAVLKCVFVGVPLAAVTGLADRADAPLARMLVAFAHERVAAARDVPPDIWVVADRFPLALRTSALPAELNSQEPARRAAARRALAGRAGTFRPEET